MDTVRRIFMFSPLLGAVLGYLVDGVAGATSGFVIPAGPLVLGWVFGPADDALRPYGGHRDGTARATPGHTRRIHEDAAGAPNR
jgi:hypothetical protein